SGPYSSIRVSVPDVYDGRAGLSYVAPNVVFSLGGRVDGIPMRDLIGRSDGFRRPAIIGYVEPALSVTRGRGTYTISAPVRAYAVMDERCRIGSDVVVFGRLVDTLQDLQRFAPFAGNRVEMPKSREIRDGLLQSFSARLVLRLGFSIFVLSLIDTRKPEVG